MSSARWFLVVGTVLLGAALLGPPAPAAAGEAGCGDVAVVFARGSGQRLAGRESVTFLSGLSTRLGESVRATAYELGSASYGGARYPAIGVGVDSGDAFANLLDAGAFWSGNEGHRYRASVASGATELRAYLEQRARTCPGERLVLGGYSQGAQVVGDALPRLSRGLRDRIAFVGLFGDPKLSLPEGRGIFPAGCRGRSLSPWRRGNVSCFTDNGVLDARTPYVPADVAARTGSWCDRDDPICNSNLADFLHSTHGTYALPGRAVDEAAREAATAVRAALGTRGQGINVTPAHLTAPAKPAPAKPAPAKPAPAAPAAPAAAATAAPAAPATAVRAARAVEAAPAVAARRAVPVAAGLPQADPSPDPAPSRTPDAGAPGGASTNSAAPVSPAPGGAETSAPASEDPSPGAPPSGTGPSETQPSETGPSETPPSAPRPAAALVIGEYWTRPGVPVTFDASASALPPTAIAAYRWDFDGDGTTDRTTTTPTADHTYATAFTGRARLRLDATDGAELLTSAPVHVDDVGLEPRLPAGPAQVTVRAAHGPSGALVRWTPPSGPSRVDAWRVHDADGRLLAHVPATATEVDLPSLPDRTTALTVEAVNAYGSSAPTTAAPRGDGAARFAAAPTRGEAPAHAAGHAPDEHPAARPENGVSAGLVATAAALLLAIGGTLTLLMFRAPVRVTPQGRHRRRKSH